tara:strand:+ start:74 stop:238 length:165 start_codon:yes stop_codon:yes gene_type:complete
MILIKEMLKRTCYGFSFGTGVGLSINISPKHFTDIWPDQAISTYYINKESEKHN